MKLSSDTIKVLQNFSTINQSILFKPGNVQRTISPQKNIFAEATIKEEFPIECGIYELPKFLNTLSLFDDPDLNFQGNYVDITSAKCSNKIRYFYASSTLIVAPPEKTLQVDEEVDSFNLDQDSLTKLSKAALIMAVPDFVIESTGKERTIKTCNNKNKSSNSFTVSQSVKKGNTYSVILNIDNLKIITDDYNVIIGKIKGTNVVQFVGTSVKYWIGAEA